MPTLSTRVSDGEFKAITEYANVSGLSVSDLMKKILINKICWLWLENSKADIQGENSISKFTAYCKTVS